MARERVSILKGAMDLLILKALSWGPMHELSTWARFADAVAKIVSATEKPAWVQS